MKTKISLSVLLLAFWGVLVCGSIYGQAPSLSLKDSLPKAEDALTKANIDLNNYFLYSISFSHSSKGDYWYYTFRPNTPSEYGQIYVKVYMSGETEISGNTPQ